MVRVRVRGRGRVRVRVRDSDLLAVMGHEVLVDGCFNADPHPGNILYLAETEQLGLIDYGQVKRLTELERLNCAKAVLLVAASFEHDPRLG